MKKMCIVSFLVSSAVGLSAGSTQAPILEVRVADALMSESALGHVVTAFEKSEEPRKQCIKSMLADCSFTKVELQALKALVREVRELLPVVFLLQGDCNSAYNAALDESLKKEFAVEIGSNVGAVVSGRFVPYKQGMSENYYDRSCFVGAAVNEQITKDPKYARYFKAQERLEELGEQAQEFLKVMGKQFAIKMAEKGDSLKGIAALYVGLMFNQLAEAFIEAADELHNKAA